MSTATATEKKQGILPAGELTDLFIEQVRDIYWAEKQLAKALTKMERAATSRELKKAFADHREETTGQIERLEKVFELMDRAARGKKCEAMQGLLDEAEELIDETDDETLVRDVALIAAAQKVEHYEIASYGTLATLANVLGSNEIKKLLGKNLDEEKAADELLTKIATTEVNRSAKRE